MLTKERKAELIKEFSGDLKNTGIPEVQVALLTERVKILTEHLKVYKKDKHSRRGMRLLLGKRKSLLHYLKHKDIERYRALIGKLGLKDKA